MREGKESKLSSLSVSSLDLVCCVELTSGTGQAWWGRRSEHHTLNPTQMYVLCVSTAPKRDGPTFHSISPHDTSTGARIRRAG